MEKAVLMPTYGYRCTACSAEFEEFQRLADPLLRECPSCHKESLIRIIGGGAGLVFKGSGFYLTDYKNSSKNPSPGSSEKSTSAKSGSESKQEQAPKTPPAPSADSSAPKE